MENRLLEDIMYRFDKNFGRVNNLLILYETLTSGRKGRRSIGNLDLLRVSVVMLHSTLEDYLRNILNWRLPEIASKDFLNKIPMFSNNHTDLRKTKFELGELIEHKEILVKDVISKSIQSHLNTVSFNNIEDIISNLKTIGISVNADIRNAAFPVINEMITRRHNIVHQADRESITSDSWGAVKSIKLSSVIKYKNNVDIFVAEVNRLLISPNA